MCCTTVTEQQLILRFKLKRCELATGYSWPSNNPIEAMNCQSKVSVKDMKNIDRIFFFIQIHTFSWIKLKCFQDCF